MIGEQPSQPDETPEIQGVEQQEYNFEIMQEVEESMLSLVGKLKDKIEAGEYYGLISDEAGGRVPTLVLRAIVKRKGYQKENGVEKPRENIETYLGVVPGGSKDGLEKYINKLKIPKDKKLLIVTQFISRGSRLRQIMSFLKKAGLDNFDIAAASIAYGAPEAYEEFREEVKKIYG